MSGLVNLIKGLISGILGFVGGLLGGKKADASTTGEPQAVVKTKKKGYFLELDESSVAPASAPAANAITATSVGSPEKPAEEKSSNKKSSSRKEKLAALAKGEKPAAAATVVAAVAPASVPGAATSAPAAPKPESNEVAFAAKYLGSPAATPRRRPGANMSSFLSMARTMK
jgi:hypothetical protein